MPKLGENYRQVELRAGARQGSVRKLERGTIERAMCVSQPVSPRGLLPLRDETRPGVTATPGSGCTIIAQFGLHTWGDRLKIRSWPRA